MDAGLDVFEQIDLKDALVVVAFPTMGAAAPIAAQYLRRHLGLPLVGQLRHDELRHIMAVQDGVATSAVRIYGGELACGLDEGCPNLFVVCTEIGLPAEVAGDLAEVVLEWAGAGKAHLVVALEGVNRDGDQEPAVYAAATDKDVLAELEKANVKPAGQALVGGTAARLLLGAKAHGVRAGAILVEASSDHPDGRAAAALIQALDRLVPEVQVDAKPLLKEALDLEEQMRKSTAPAQTFAPSRHTFI